MKQITAYKLINAGSIDILEKDINKLISEGWQPLGAPFITTNFILQPMVKYAEICEHQYRVKRYGNQMSGYDQVECMLCGQLPTVTG